MTTLVLEDKEKKTIWKAEMLKLKNYLKENATLLTETKKERREAQRNGEWNKVWKTEALLYRMKRDYRHKHIAYSELRGKTREQIERPAKDNKPIESLIQEIKNDILEKLL
jgi:hypothetical protein